MCRGRLVQNSGMADAADTGWIVEKAKAEGFDLCGVVRAESFPELEHTEEWLSRGYAGEMRYLHDERRGDPRNVFPEIRSVIVCGLNYNTALPRSIDAVEKGSKRARGWISRYAWGSDYHEVLRERLDRIVVAMKGKFAVPFEARTYSDTGPIQERVAGKYAGLGWLGKNTLLLNRTQGSWFFLGVILTSLELRPSIGAGDLPEVDLCGSCRKCIEACPTNALAEPYVMDARRCISYLTIELRGGIPKEFREAMGTHVFGCDICQDVCPWNRRASVTRIREFEPRTLDGNGEDGKTETLFRPQLAWLAGLTEEEFRRVFRGSPIKRTKWKGLVRNACIALGNAKLERDSEDYARTVQILKRLAESDETSISESARWALSRIE